LVFACYYFFFFKYVNYYIYKYRKNNNKQKTKIETIQQNYDITKKDKINLEKSKQEVLIKRNNEERKKIKKEDMVLIVVFYFISFFGAFMAFTFASGVGLFIALGGMLVAIVSLATNT